MTHRYALAAVLLAALSVPAAAQQTTPSDTSKKSTSGTTVTESAGSIADTAAKANANPNAAAPSTVAPSPGATVTTPNSNAPSSMAPSTSPSTGATVTTPAPTSGNAAETPSGVSAGATNPASAGAANAASAGATGQIQPTSGTIKVDVKVAESLANTVKISADSAFALAKASPDAGEISSAELEMTDNRLVYQVKMVKGAGASTVYVDAMTGEVVKDKKFGGLKAAAENQEESQKLLEAKEKEQKQIKEEKKAP
jgi:uncharacterized membrane protein YkoI